MKFLTQRIITTNRTRSEITLTKVIIWEFVLRPITELWFNWFTGENIIFKDNPYL